jgi:hypothetical protein
MCRDHAYAATEAARINADTDHRSTSSASGLSCKRRLDGAAQLEFFRYIEAFYKNGATSSSTEEHAG